MTTDVAELRQPAGTRVADAVGRTLAAAGVRAAFGVMGSGNLELTNALRDGGARVVTARHENGAICMADGYARVTGEVAVCSVHQGPGLTNAITGLTEAAKSRTPLVLLAADTPSAALRSNFRIDQDALVRAVGAVAERVHGPATAVADTLRAVRRARVERRAVVLMAPLDVQAATLPADGPLPVLAPVPAPPRPADAAVAEAAAALAAAKRPAIVAGRGAVLSGAGAALRALGERTGAVLATSAVANGLFRGDPFDLGIAGGFSSPLAAELLAASDVVVAFGAALNQWTTRHGHLIAPGARVVQVDLDPDAIGAHRPADVAVVGDAAATARALLDVLAPAAGRRSPELAEKIARRRWRDEPYDDAPAAGTLDPRTLSIALDDLLPAERTVAVDSGHFMGWPSMYVAVPDAHGFVFPQAFQCVGLGLGNAIGAALGRPDRLAVAMLGDGGAFMALAELETAARLGLPLLVVVYDDAAYAAEVHHFAPMGHAVDLARFADADLAAIARGAGCDAITARAVRDLDAIRDWLGRRDRPLLVDAKIDPEVRAEWLEEAFRH